MQVKWLDRKLFPKVIVISGILLVVIATIDSFTSYELGLTTFYLLPIAGIAWYGGYGWGILGASLALLAWLCADWISGHPYSQTFYVVWAGVDHGLAFFIFMGGIGWLSNIYQHSQETSESLRKTNAYLENLINYANAPIIVWDPEFKITRFNHAFEGLTRLTEAKVLGKSLEILFPSDLAASSMDLIRKTLTGEHWDTVEIKVLNLDGMVSSVEFRNDLWA